ncbi:DUF1351 domain-containing protein [Clostridium tagluense]|uniref:DUF1351 domain-containing protein n=1 Tax=Clostridium tagluense TaxID=360422 RepID=UPI001C0BAB49|nr:DUF1351 domain-containing protein [Clostridium tagluense]MBU3126773.1 DUF1351 domain-containing protein [Clostridium tagluense]
MEEIKLEKQLPVITMNFEEVKASLIAGAEKYKNILVTEEGLKDCKSMQKELSSIRIKLDTYRKDVKREMSKPIDIFEDQCKKLIELIVTVENPIKKGISVFDQKKRDANRKIAEDIILSAITEYELNEKYGKQLNVLDKYCNLTAKASDVKTDVEQRVFLLLQEQTREIETLQIMKDTIENINKNIDAKLSIQDFQALIDMNSSPVRIMAQINARGESVRRSELQAIEERKAKAEKEVLDRIARAEREIIEKAEIERKNKEIEAEKIRIANLPKEVIPEVEKKVAPLQERIEVPAPRFIETPTKSKTLYFIEMRVEGNLDEIKALSQFLRDREYKYIATNKGLI